MFRTVTKNEPAIDAANKIVNELLSLAKKYLETERVRVQKIAAALEIRKSDYRRFVLAELYAGAFHNMSYNLYVNGDFITKDTKLLEKLRLDVETLMDTIIKRDERTFVHSAVTKR